MDTISVNKFRDNMKSVVEQVVNRHEPLKVTRKAGDAFILISADDWEREQETLYVLQSQSLMQHDCCSTLLVAPYFSALRLSVSTEHG